MSNTRPSERSGHRRRQRHGAMLMGSFAPTIRNKCQHICGENGDIYALEPAVVLGLNHCPTSFPSSLSAIVILCTLNGHRVDGESKTTSKSGRRLRNLRYSLAEGDAAILRTEKSGDNGEGKYHVRRRNSGCISVVASND